MNGNDLNNGDDKQHSEDEGTWSNFPILCRKFNRRKPVWRNGCPNQKQWDYRLEARLYANFDIISNDLNNFKKFTMNNAVEQFTNELRGENAKLKKENECLIDRLITVSYTVGDLNTKIKDLENEKASLVATLRLFMMNIVM